MSKRPKFSVEEEFLGVTVVKMNSAMAELLSTFIEEVSDKEREIFALGRALQDPVESRELRDEKRRIHDRRRNRDRRVFDEEEAVA